MDKMKNEGLSRRACVRKDVSDIKCTEKVCNGLDMWSVGVGADD